MYFNPNWLHDSFIYPDGSKLDIKLLQQKPNTFVEKYLSKTYVTDIHIWVKPKSAMTIWQVHIVVNIL